jgi:hypothetical protein
MTLQRIYEKARRVLSNHCMLMLKVCLKGLHRPPGSHRRAGHFDNGATDHTVASLVVWR